MSYIGRGTESISNVEVLDNLTFDGSASYTLQKSSVNFVPSSANNLLISISGVVQQGNFSVSGSTITFDTTVSASDTCDWILHYGTGLITTVADGAITEAKLGNNAVTASKIDSSVALGKIGQITEATYTTVSVSTSSSYTNTGFTVSITPSSTSSKVLINVNTTVQVDTGRGILSLNRSGYGDLHGDVSGSASGLVSHEGATVRSSALSFSYLDSPSSTSALTYTLRQKSDGGASFSIGGHGSVCTLMYAMEVLA